MMLLWVEGFNTSAITADPEPNLWIGAILDVGQPCDPAAGAMPGTCLAGKVMT